MSIGQNIKKLRKSSGLTLSQLADRMGLCLSTISRWENDELTVSAYQIQQLCDVFSCSSDSILFSEDRETEVRESCMQFAFEAKGLFIRKYDPGYGLMKKKTEALYGRYKRIVRNTSLTSECGNIRMTPISKLNHRGCSRELDLDVILSGEGNLVPGTELYNEIRDYVSTLEKLFCKNIKTSA
ncbi:MAG: helix-turn-helix transcriptional regulator [Parasporobacterium sp.]|nr:helix-turn-helix transcriptional regulator [Parasporobacterium sp.]